MFPMRYRLTVWQRLARSDVTQRRVPLTILYKHLKKGTRKL